MIIKVNVNSEIKVNILVDLHKLKVIMEVNNLKVNKSQIARELDVDTRTVGKYLNGYVKPTTRNRKSPIDDFKPNIQSLLSDESIQVFYYKRVLWQYLKDNHGFTVHNLLLEDTYLAMLSLMIILNVEKKVTYLISLL